MEKGVNENKDPKVEVLYTLLDITISYEYKVYL